MIEIHREFLKVKGNVGCFRKLAKMRFLPNELSSFRVGSLLLKQNLHYPVAVAESPDVQRNLPKLIGISRSSGNDSPPTEIFISLRCHTSDTISDQNGFTSSPETFLRFGRILYSSQDKCQWSYRNCQTVKKDYLSARCLFNIPARVQSSGSVDLIKM